MMYLNYTSSSNLLNLGYKINETWIYTKNETLSLVHEDSEYETNNFENVDLNTSIYSSFFLVIALSFSLHSLDLSGSFNAK